MTITIKKKRTKIWDCKKGLILAPFFFYYIISIMKNDFKRLGAKNKMYNIE